MVKEGIGSVETRDTWTNGLTGQRRADLADGGHQRRGQRGDPRQPRASGLQLHGRGGQEGLGTWWGCRYGRGGVGGGATVVDSVAGWRGLVWLLLLLLLEQEHGGLGALQLLHLCPSTHNTNIKQNTY